jgi:hypothetical protein
MLNNQMETNRGLIDGKMYPSGNFVMPTCTETEMPFEILFKTYDNIQNRKIALTNKLAQALAESTFSEEILKLIQDREEAINLLIHMKNETDSSRTY